ncbi:hypothetical protein ACFL27_14330 [candidate division CSSED10-310 bacterium]|uniref:Uncharacterized protein n=1 Tax=candidate division CSSED10-310 bacterium TaxID=2855610 RepID=A0ABV6YZ77_UNCC1
MKLFRNLRKLKFCKSNKDKELSKYFNKIISSLDIHNVFNPSFYCDKDVKIFAFRAIQNGADELLSFISIDSNKGHTIKNISKDFSKKLGVKRLIDPKITKLNGVFYITFNSGWNPEGNDIFIMKIYPKIELPKRVVYKNRQKQERNWAFYSEDGEIYVLYWINPLKILRVKKKGQKTWELEDFYCGKKNSRFSNDLTIGTQLSHIDDEYCFIAHKKTYFLKKKIYVGRFCTFDFKNKEINSGKYWLAHSLRSMFGSRIKHNTNCFSCIYFSGMQVTNDLIKLGYGVNDVGFGFSKHKLGELMENKREEIFNKIYKDNVWGGAEKKKEKYSSSARALIALLKYGSGFPFYRLAMLQKDLGIPLPPSTQRDVMIVTLRAQCHKKTFPLQFPWHSLTIPFFSRYFFILTSIFSHKMVPNTQYLGWYVPCNSKGRLVTERLQQSMLWDVQRNSDDGVGKPTPSCLFCLIYPRRVCNFLFLSSKNTFI